MAAEDSDGGARGSQRALVERAVARGDYGLLPLRFSASVLDRYRERADARLLRTRSVGRIAIVRGWSIDAGIAPGEEEIEVFAADFAERLPESERAHWLEHLASPPSSANFALMRLSGNACIDDGEPTAW